jgi:hypothetical protein
VSPYADTRQEHFVDTSFVVNGISQSAVISGYEKGYLIAHPLSDRTISFVLIANENRPNGGLYQRFVGGYVPFVGMTFNGATPTNSARANPLITVDTARQYDGWTDFPTNPLNVLASLNAVFGAVYVHGDYLDVGLNAQLQGQYQDTTYYLDPTPILPLLMPVSGMPLIGMPLALSLDAPLRVLVEAGYDRTVNPGQPTAAQLSYFPDPIATAKNLLVAIPTGWDDAIAYVRSDPSARPFGTAPQPVYGVGGPPVYAGAVDPYGPPVPDATSVKSNNVALRSTAAATDPGSQHNRAVASRSAAPVSAQRTLSRPLAVAGAGSHGLDSRQAGRGNAAAARR